MAELERLKSMLAEHRALLSRVEQGQLDPDDLAVISALVAELIEEVERNGQEDVVIELFGREEAFGAKMVGTGTENSESRDVVHDGSKQSNSPR